MDMAVRKGGKNRTGITGTVKVIVCLVAFFPPVIAETGDE
jgi:hypothetical protein